MDLSAPGYEHVPDEANQEALVTIPPNTTFVRTISQIDWSYGGNPTNGKLTIALNDVVKRTYFISYGGPGQVSWRKEFRIPVNTEVKIRLTAGGSGVRNSVSYIP